MSFTISLSAVRPMASGLHAETRRAERFPKIPSTAPRNAVRACGKKSGDIHNELKEKFTTGGGGYKGFCDYEEIKAAIKECDGLDGARLEACYAEFGCDVDRVTEHYAKAAGIEKKSDAKKM